MTEQLKSNNNVMAMVWSSCNWLLPPAGGFSICKTAHRIWLKILSIAHKKELQSLTMLNDETNIIWSPLSISLCLGNSVTSLIKIVLWLKFSHRWKAGRGFGGQGSQDTSQRGWCPTASLSVEGVEDSDSGGETRPSSVLCWMAVEILLLQPPWHGGMWFLPSTENPRPDLWYNFRSH